MTSELEAFRLRLISKFEEAKNLFETYSHAKAGVLNYKHKETGELFPLLALSIYFTNATGNDPDGVELVVTSGKKSASGMEGISAFIMYTDESGEVVGDFNDGVPVEPTESALNDLMNDIPRLLGVLEGCVQAQRKAQANQ